MELFPYFPVIILIIFFVIVKLGLFFVLLGEGAGLNIVPIYAMCIGVFSIIFAFIAFLIYLLNKLPWGFNIGNRWLGMGTILGTVGLIGLIVYASSGLIYRNMYNREHYPCVFPCERKMINKYSSKKFE